MTDVPSSQVRGGYGYKYATTSVDHLACCDGVCDTSYMRHRTWSLDEYTSFESWSWPWSSSCSSQIKHYYENKNNIQMGPAYSFGSQTYSKSRNPRVEHKPGPNAYSPPTPAQRHPGPAFSITPRRTPSRFAVKKTDLLKIDDHAVG